MKTLLKKSWPFLLLAVLSFTIHFAFLSYPAQVVFDEVHFGKFVAAYSTGQYYFDIHPPLGKLMIAGFAKLAGVNSVFDFAQIGETLPANTLFALRFLPAFFGSIFVLIFAWLAYLISRSKQTAIIAGFLILLDNAFLVQSKFILVDIFMLSFEALTLCFFFLWQRQETFKAKWFAYLTLTGLFAGLTISIKWTGLAVIGIMGVILFFKIFSKKLTDYLKNAVIARSEAGADPSLRSGQAPQSQDIATVHGIATLPSRLAFASAKRAVARKDKLKESVVGLLFLLAFAFLVYLLPFWLHFQLLPNSGSGDAFMSQNFQQELKYGRDNVYQPLPFWQKFIELNKTMYIANASLTAEHPFGSKWFAWPLNSKPVYYWNQETFAALSGWRAGIYLSGNPILWWLTSLGIIFSLLTVAVKKGRVTFAFPILLLAYLANLLPFIFVSRVAFLYHYLASAMYAIIILGLLLSGLCAKSKTFFWTIIVLIFFSFAVTAPLSYGWPLPLQFSQLATQFITLFN